MEYHGKLYGKFGMKYFDTSHTTDEWDAMEKQLAELKDENEALKLDNSTLVKSMQSNNQNETMLLPKEKDMENKIVDAKQHYRK